MKKLSILLAALLCASTSNYAQQLFTMSFPGTNDCQTTSNTGLQLPYVLADAWTRSSGTACEPTADAFNNSKWDVPSQSDRYIECVVHILPGYQLTINRVDFSTNKSTYGPPNAKIAYDNDGSNTFVNNKPYTVPASATIISWAFTNAITMTGGTQIKFRIYGWGTSTSSGTMRLNSFTLYGNLVVNSPFIIDYTKNYVGIGTTALPNHRLEVDGSFSLTNGRVMIGAVNENSMNNNNYALGVAGTAIVKKLIVKKDATTWPDHIFDENHKLVSLDSLQAYLKQNHHLPDVPSADDVKREGIDVTNMQAALLKKIEELTLYIIRQEKVQVKMKQQLISQQHLLRKLQKKYDSDK